jgi:RecA-family ATPase
VFERVELANLAEATAPPVAYAVELLLPRQHVTVLGGHGGMGKTSLGLVLACHAVCGREWAGLPTAKVRVLFVSLEDEGPLLRGRLRNIARTYDLPIEWLEAGLDVLDGTRRDGTLAVEVAEFGTRRLSPTPALAELQTLVAMNDYGLLVIDNASDAFAGNENDRRQVRQFMRWLRNIARDSGAALLLLAHIDKAAAKSGATGNSYSGSTAWHNSARSRLALVDRDGVPVLFHEKHNLNAGMRGPITLGFNELGVLVPARQATQEIRTDTNRIVLEAVRHAIGLGTTVSAAMSGSSTVYHALEPHLPEDFTRDRQSAKRRVYAAINDLLSDGRLFKNAFTNSRRQRKTCLGLEQAERAEGAE